MIRRGFWVLVGATGGIMGYRRVTALGRQLSETLAPAAAAQAAATEQAAAIQATASEQSATAKAAAAKAAASKAKRQQLSRQARRGLIRGTIRFTRDARRFSRDARRFTRDVREGMDLYMVRRDARQSPTLDTGAESRRPPARPLIGALGASTDNPDRVKDDR